MSTIYMDYDTLIGFLTAAGPLRTKQMYRFHGCETRPLNAAIGTQRRRFYSVVSFLESRDGVGVVHYWQTTSAVDDLINGRSMSGSNSGALEKSNSFTRFLDEYLGDDLINAQPDRPSDLTWTEGYWPGLLWIEEEKLWMLGEEASEVPPE